MANKFALLFCLLIVFFSCVAPTEKAEDLNSASLQGSWQDHLDPGYLYFAASTHKLTFKNDSFFLKIHEFTDVINVSDTCDSNEYTLFINGMFSVGNQDDITLDGVFADSLKNPVPFCGCNHGPRQSGRYHTTFRGRLVGNALHLKNLSYPNLSDWELLKE